MNKKKERFEVLLEEIRDKVQIIAEGHNVLLNGQETLHSEIKGTKSEMKQMEERLGNRISGAENKLDKKIDYVHASLKSTFYALNEKLEDHIKQPSHAA
ncbi:MAG: hypothetical protein ABIA67_02780 [Candidatus Margulisiibacteriota bacterium]